MRLSLAEVNVYRDLTSSIANHLLKDLPIVTVLARIFEALRPVLANKPLCSLLEETVIHKVLSKKLSRLVGFFCLDAWRLFGLTPLSQPLAELASFASGQSQTIGFVFPDPTLLSHGEPDVTETTNL